MKEMVDEVVKFGKKGLDVVRDLGRRDWMGGGVVFIRNANRCCGGSTGCIFVVVSISATEARY